MKTPQFLLTRKIRLTLRRYPVPTYEKGRLVQPPPTLVRIQANVQPAVKQTGAAFMSEEVKTKKGLVVFSKDELRQVVDHGTTRHQADRFIYEGEEYEVVKVVRYNMGTLDHYEALAIMTNPVPVVEGHLSKMLPSVGFSATGTMT